MELTTCFDFVSAGRYPYTGRLGILSAEDRQQVHRALDEDALKQAHEESAQIVEKARKSAQAEYESRMDAADTEAQKIIANAHKSIDLEREKTVQELQSQIAGLAMAATAKVLGDTDQAAQNKLMYEQFLAKTGGLNDTNSK